LNYVKIFASGDLDEFKIELLLEKGAEIDAFGVGTKMGTSEDKPYVDVIYKLCEIMCENGDFSPIMKLSEKKVTLPGRKQVYRFKNEEEKFKKDVIALETEKVEGEPLLVKVMEKGEITYNLPSLEEIRATAAKSLALLPEKYKKVTSASEYPVEISQELEKLIAKLEERIRETEILNSN
jgi:nicotinate phosphoribosyltransferase